MTSAAMETSWSWESMLHAWAENDAPEGWRAEITEKGITVTPPPSPTHGLISDLVDEELRPALPPGTGLPQNVGITITPAGRLYVPDHIVLPRGVLVDDPPSVSAEHALLVVEITSKDNADEDRGPKKSAYARGGVPLYLLIDRWAEHGPQVILFSDPAGFHYRTSHTVPFGESITIPAPFDIELDTSAFPPPPVAT